MNRTQIITSMVRTLEERLSVMFAALPDGIFSNRFEPLAVL